MSTCAAGGVITSYTVFYRVRQVMPTPLSDWLNKSVSSDSSNTLLRLSSTQDYEIIVHASTALGLNTSLQPVPLVISYNTSDRELFFSFDSFISSDFIKNYINTLIQNIGDVLRHSGSLLFLD